MLATAYSLSVYFPFKLKVCTILLIKNAVNPVTGQTLDITARQIDCCNVIDERGNLLLLGSQDRNRFYRNSLHRSTRFWGIYNWKWKIIDSLLSWAIRAVKLNFIFKITALPSSYQTVLQFVSFCVLKTVEIKYSHVFIASFSNLGNRLISICICS